MRTPWIIYLVSFHIFLFAPLVVVTIFAFNASPFPAPPWQGFTSDWFLAQNAQNSGKAGIFQDHGMMRALANSLIVGALVALFSVAIGATNAFLLERRQFPGRAFLSSAMVWPLVIPGVILGTSILSFASDVAQLLETWLKRDIDFLRPGLTLVVIGQCSFGITVATLIIGARLRRLDRSQEEAAADLGGNSRQVFMSVTMPFLRPALIGAVCVCFLLSLENFNTTIMLIGSEATLPIYMYGQIRDGSTPAINAVSVLMMSFTLLMILCFTLKRDVRR